MGVVMRRGDSRLGVLTFLLAVLVSLSSAVRADSTIDLAAYDAPATASGAVELRVTGIKDEARFLLCLTRYAVTDLREADWPWTEATTPLRRDTISGDKLSLTATTLEITFTTLLRHSLLMTGDVRLTAEVAGGEARIRASFDAIEVARRRTVNSQKSLEESLEFIRSKTEEELRRCIEAWVANSGEFCSVRHNARVEYQGDLSGFMVHLCRLEDYPLPAMTVKELKEVFGDRFRLDRDTFRYTPSYLLVRGEGEAPLALSFSTRTLHHSWHGAGVGSGSGYGEVRSGSPYQRRAGVAEFPESKKVHVITSVFVEDDDDDDDDDEDDEEEDE